MDTSYMAAPGMKREKVIVNISTATLMNYVSLAFDVNVNDLKSNSRRHRILLARNVLWKELRNRNYSVTEVGKITGHDHSSVSVAMRKYEATVLNSEWARQCIERLKKYINVYE